MIDNARASGHNAVTAMAETIVTSTFDMPLQIRVLHGPLHHMAPLLGSEDIEDAYRKIPVLLAHQRFSVVVSRQSSHVGSGL
eukprot:4138775-Amphidinium_carterae.2